MLSVIMLSVIMLSVIMLSVMMLSVIMLSIIMLSVIMLIIVAPKQVFITLGQFAFAATGRQFGLGYLGIQWPLP